jgi:hypothetical protein
MYRRHKLVDLTYFIDWEHFLSRILDSHGFDYVYVE